MRKSIAATALVAALVLGGCTAQIGAAAVVDGQAISTSTLDRTTRELNDLFSVNTRDVLSMLIIAPSYLEGAAANGVAKSREQARDYLVELKVNDPTSGLDPAGFSDATLDLVRFDLALREMSTLANAQEIGVSIQEKVTALDVQVNPRFGEFSAEQSAITAVSPEWLVQPGTA
ncbi:MAG: hypothetical protein GX593_09295 [Actinomycetales bacterium]|nr:hypothetical protein [Actinomycetales bacterium]